LISWSDDGSMPALPERLEAKVRPRALASPTSTHASCVSPASAPLHEHKQRARTHARSLILKPSPHSSQVHKQAAGVVRKLLAAQERGKGGASLKSLTLAPAILFKKATHAICCETLKCALARPLVPPWVASVDAGAGIHHSGL
jgi:hypothetical protein